MQELLIEKMQAAHPELDPEVVRSIVAETYIEAFQYGYSEGFMRAEDIQAERDAGASI